MSSSLYDSLLNLEALFILILSTYFIVLYLKTNKAKIALSKFIIGYSHSELVIKFALTFFLGTILGIGILYKSWWPYDPLLCFALIFSLGTMFIHESFLLAIFILLLFIRPWELLVAKYSNQPELQLQYESMHLASIPQVWFLFLFGNFIITWSAKKKIVWNALDKGVGLFVLWMLVPILVKSNPDELTVFIDTLFRAGLIYFLIRWYIRDEFSYQVIAKTLSFIGWFLMITAVLQFVANYGGESAPTRAEAFGLIKNSNDFAALIVLCYPFILKDCNSKILKILVVLITFITIYTTQSRGAYGGAIVALVTYFTSHQQLKIPSFKKILAAAISLFVLFKIYSIFTVRNANDIHDSTWGRFNYWIAAVRMALYSPGWGVGFGNYPKNYERYTFEFLEFGQRTAHSSFFLVVGEGGFIGAYLYYKIFKNGIQYVAKLRQLRPEIFASLFGFLFTMLFLSQSYLFFSYILLALINALYIQIVPAADTRQEQLSRF